MGIMVCVIPNKPNKTALQEWINFYEKKKMFAEIREVKIKNSKEKKFQLWRELTDFEIAELTAGITVIKNDTLQFALTDTKRPIAKRRGVYKLS
jgi:(p)ppGpp synthase/HD superfamily hydrolase